MFGEDKEATKILKDRIVALEEENRELKNIIKNVLELINQHGNKEE